MSLEVTIEVGADECGPYNMSIEINPRTRPDVKAKHPGFASKKERLRTFDTWPLDLPDRETLAAAGFFYAGNSDHCVCYHCGKGLKDWETDDDPWLEHKKHFPECAISKRRRPSVSSKPQKVAVKKPDVDARSTSDPPKPDCYLCKVCFENEMCMTFLPCKHVIACEKCTRSLKECVVCRTKIESSFRVYLQ